MTKYLLIETQTTEEEIELDPKDVLTLSEAAVLLGIDPTTLTFQIEDGQFTKLHQIQRRMGRPAATGRGERVLKRQEVETAVEKR